MKYRQYIGIVLGAVYGLLYRFLCEFDGGDSFFDFQIYTVSFVWVLPIAIGIIPVLFARKEITKSKWKPFLYPIFSVILFFLFAISSGLEDWLCLLIITFPFTLSAGLIGLLVNMFMAKKDNNKMYSILILPFLLNPIESYLPIQQESFSISSNIHIETTRAQVWDNLIEVPEITEEEYQYSIYNYIGVPRPVKSQLKIIDGQEFRIGYFTDNLKLYETISHKDSLEFLAFDIHIDRSELRDLPTDNHLLNSSYFTFGNISYQVEKLGENKTNLILNCNYRLHSNMNGYANFWAKRIILDFEENLLQALKLKIEKQGNRN